ncbi:MAG: hypothetical protein ACREF3_10895, partial [Acetobacteraceae bacterium]
FCARAPYDGLAEAVAARFGGLTDTVTLEFLPGDPAPVRRRLIEAIQAIPHAFRGFRTEERSGGAIPGVG